jgi:hypothetical protein
MSNISADPHGRRELYGSPHLGGYRLRIAASGGIEEMYVDTIGGRRWLGELGLELDPVRGVEARDQEIIVRRPRGVLEFLPAASHRPDKLPRSQVRDAARDEHLERRDS